MLVAVKPSSQVSSRTRQESKEERMANMKKVTNTSLLRDQGGGPPAKRRRLEAEDLMAFEELDDNFEQEWQSNERFQVIRSIGRGAYATVYKAIDKEHNNAVVAMKKMAFVVDPCHIIPSHIAREITNLRRLHDSTRQTPIIRLLDVTLSEGRYANELIVDLVFEYMESDLDRHIRQSIPNGLGEVKIQNYLEQILTGVEWMHANNIIHRDLKPQNILVSKGVIKIADFGLSRVIDDSRVLSTQVVTQWYRAPELLLHSSYSKSVDIWSVGCIFAEMYLGRPLFASKTNVEIAQLREIFKVIGTPLHEQWPSETLVIFDQFEYVPSTAWSDIIPTISNTAQDLLSKMLLFQGEVRVTAKEALCNHFFKSASNSKVTSSSSFTTLSHSPSPSPLFSPSQNSTHSLLSTTTVDSVDSGIHDL